MCGFYPRKIGNGGVGGDAGRGGAVVITVNHEQLPLLWLVEAAAREGAHGNRGQGGRRGHGGRGGDGGDGGRGGEVWFSSSYALILS